MAASTRPVPEKSTIHLKDLLEPGGEKSIVLDVGEDLDLSGPEFTDKDREDFRDFQRGQADIIGKLVREAFASVKEKAAKQREEYKAKAEQLSKKRKTVDGAAVPGAAAAAKAGAPPPAAPAAQPAAAAAGVAGGRLDKSEADKAARRAQILQLTRAAAEGASEAARAKEAGKQSAASAQG